MPLRWPRNRSFRPPSFAAPRCKHTTGAVGCSQGRPGHEACGACAVFFRERVALIQHRLWCCWLPAVLPGLLRPAAAAAPAAGRRLPPGRGSQERAPRQSGGDKHPPPPPRNGRPPGLLPNRRSRRAGSPRRRRRYCRAPSPGCTGRQASSFVPGQRRCRRQLLRLAQPAPRLEPPPTRAAPPLLPACLPPSLAGVQVLPGGLASQVASYAKQNTEAGVAQPYHPRHRGTQRRKQNAQAGPGTVD